MQPELTTELIVDTRLDSYRGFFDFVWIAAFGDIAERSKLRTAAFDLSRDWKGIAVAARMPWLMIESLLGLHHGITSTSPPFYQRMTHALGEYLLKDQQISHTRRRRFMEKLDELRSQVEQEIAQMPPAIDREKLWQEYMSINEFWLALWNTQRIAYGAIYYAYENFLQRSVAVAKDDEEYRAKRTDQLKSDFAGVFGEPLMRDCLEASEIEVARIVRNCLTHDGGRASAVLGAMNSDITTKNGELHIMPENVHALFDLLKLKATKIVEAGVSIPSLVQNLAK